jgi:hypothetical protein
MNPTHKRGELMYCYVNIKLRVTSDLIVLATMKIIESETKPTKKSIFKEVKEILHSSGENWSFDCGDEYMEESEKKEQATIIAKQLFPLYFQPKKLIDIL